MENMKMTIFNYQQRRTRGKLWVRSNKFGQNGFVTLMHEWILALLPTFVYFGYEKTFQHHTTLFVQRFDLAGLRCHVIGILSFKSKRSCDPFALLRLICPNSPNEQLLYNWDMMEKYIPVVQWSYITDWEDPVWTEYLPNDCQQHNKALSHSMADSNSLHHQIQHLLEGLTMPWVALMCQVCYHSCLKYENIRHDKQSSYF